MRKAIAFVVVATTLYACPIHAEPSLKNCKMIAGLAKSIMQARQAGAPMSNLMEAQTEQLEKLVHYLVIEAYDQPRFSTEANKQRATQDFENAVYLECAKSAVKAGASTKSSLAR